MQEINQATATAEKTSPELEPSVVRTFAGQRKSFYQNIHMLLRYREMIYMWTAREVKSRYRQSFLGAGWVIAQPVFQMIVLTVIFGKLIKVSSEGFAYPVFSYTALLPWTLFSNSIASGIPSISGNMSLISKIYFPREVLPISCILARTVDFLISSIVFVALMLWYHLPFHSTLIYVPLLILIQSIFALGIVLLGTGINVFMRDVSIALPLVLQIWMYASPVIYPTSLIPASWRTLYSLNPMAGIIDSYRRVVLLGNAPDPRLLASATVLAVLFCAVSYRYFKRLERLMSDVL